MTTLLDGLHRAQAAILSILLGAKPLEDNNSSVENWRIKQLAEAAKLLPSLVEQAEGAVHAQKNAALNNKSLLEMLAHHIVDHPTPTNIAKQKFYLAALKAAKVVMTTPVSSSNFGEMAYEYLPGDEPTKLIEALEILCRVKHSLHESRNDSYEAVSKVLAIFRKHIESSMNSSNSAEDSYVNDKNVVDIPQPITAETIMRVRVAVAGLIGFTESVEPNTTVTAEYVERLREHYVKNVLDELKAAGL